MQNEKNKKRDAEAETVPDYWQCMHRAGAKFFVDGEPVTPTDAFSQAVREDGAYMADYVWGKTGKIEQVRFDKVNPE